MKKQTLNGTWNMQQSGESERYETAIPGSVLSCLLEHKAIPDPYFRDNEYEVRDLFWNDYEFDRVFTVEAGMLEEQNIELVCYGLDTLGEIYINGTLIAKTNNMHRTWRFPVKENLHVGENNIRILFRSTLRYIEKYEYKKEKEIKYIACGVMKGNQLIRKTHSMFGWDWGAQLPDAGIFRDIVLEAYSEAKIESIRIDQHHKEEGVTLTLNTEAVFLKQKEYELEIMVSDPLGKEVIKESVAIEAVHTEAEVTIFHPQLWWPNGFGEQPLYTMQTKLKSRGKVLDEKTYTLGLRTLSVSQDKDEWGSEFAFKVNGVKIFTKGANYIPEDCIYSWITEERIEYLVKSSARANYNCLRVWGGGYYPSDTFYDLCDRYGLIVWQDLMYACNVYDVTEEFEESIVEETKDNVKRLRHHACLGLWCGNNEIESAWEHWADFQAETKHLRADYIKQFEYLLPKAVKVTDQTTFYWPSSPSSGGCFDDPDNENRGDTHYWSVWHGLLPFSDYQKHYFRFCSEFGFQSFPSMKTVKTYTEEEDRNIFSKVMESHQKNNAANGKMLYYLSENFCYPKDFDNLLYITQVLQGIAIKSGVEHFRRNRGRCMGSLYWQINDNWPVASWSSIDYFGRWKALHYMAKKFYAPTAGSLVRRGDVMEAHFQNETLQKVSANAALILKSMDLKELAKAEFKVEAEALSAVKIGEVDYSKLFKSVKTDSVFAELVITYESDKVQRETETFEPYKHILLPKAVITVHVKEESDKYIITLQTDQFANFVELDFDEADGIFEDNYFALTDKEQKQVELQKADISNGAFRDAADVKAHLKVRSLRNAY